MNYYYLVLINGLMPWQMTMQGQVVGDETENGSNNYEVANTREQFIGPVIKHLAPHTYTITRCSSLPLSLTMGTEIIK